MQYRNFGHSLGVARSSRGNIADEHFLPVAGFDIYQFHADSPLLYQTESGRDFEKISGNGHRTRNQDFGVFYGLEEVGLCRRYGKHMPIKERTKKGQQFFESFSSKKDIHKSHLQKLQQNPSKNPG
jgi:hypothetical protein